MNAQIQALVLQAGFSHNYIIDPYLSTLQQRFAELIAEDCAELCDKFQLRQVGMQPAECAGAIRQMFGVAP